MAFVEAHQELQDTDASVNELRFHSVNAIIEQIVQQLRKEVPNDTPPILPRQEFPIVTHDNHQEVPLPIQEITNATQVDPAMTTLMTTMISNMEAMRLRIEGVSTMQGDTVTTEDAAEDVAEDVSVMGAEIVDVSLRDVEVENTVPHMAIVHTII